MNQTGRHALKSFIRLVLESKLFEQDDDTGIGGEDSADGGYDYSSSPIALETAAASKTYYMEIGDIPFYITYVGPWGKIGKDDYDLIRTSDAAGFVVSAGNKRQDSTIDADTGDWNITDDRFLFFDKTLNLKSPIQGERKEQFSKLYPGLYRSLLGSKGELSIDLGADNIWLIKRRDLDRLSEVEESDEIAVNIAKDFSYPIGKSFSFFYKSTSDVLVCDSYGDDLYFGVLVGDRAPGAILAANQKYVHVVLSTIDDAAFLKPDDLGNKCAQEIMDGTYVPSIDGNPINLEKIVQTARNKTWVLVNARALREVGSVREESFSLKDVFMPTRRSPTWLVNNMSMVFDIIEGVASVIGLFFPPVMILSFAASLCNLSITSSEFEKGRASPGQLTLQLIFTVISLIPMIGAAKGTIPALKIADIIDSARVYARNIPAMVSYLKTAIPSTSLNTLVKLIPTMTTVETAFQGLLSIAISGCRAKWSTLWQTVNLSSIWQAYKGAMPFANFYLDVTRAWNSAQRIPTVWSDNKRASEMWFNLIGQTVIPDPVAIGLVDVKNIVELLNNNRGDEAAKILGVAQVPRSYRAIQDLVDKKNRSLFKVWDVNRSSKFEQLRQDIDTLDPVSSLMMKQNYNSLVEITYQQGGALKFDEPAAIEKLEKEPMEILTFISIAYIIVPAVGAQMGIDKFFAEN